MMKCPVCGGRGRARQSKVNHERVWRRRYCLDCGFRFTTWESWDGGKHGPRRHYGKREQAK